MMFGRRVIQVARGGGSIVAANAGMHATISRRTVAAAASQQHQHQHHQQQSCWANVFSIVAGGAGFVAAAGNVFIDDAAAADAEEKPAKMTCTSEVCTTDDFATMAEEHGVQIGNGVVVSVLKAIFSSSWPSSPSECGGWASIAAVSHTNIANVGLPSIACTIRACPGHSCECVRAITERGGWGVF